MIRRMQLLDPQDQLHSNRLAAVGERIRDGLLRDNKVVPVVLATLALLIFAWLVAGAKTPSVNSFRRTAKIRLAIAKLVVPRTAIARVAMGKPATAKLAVPGPAVAMPAAMVVAPETTEVLLASRPPVTLILEVARVIVGIYSAAAGICLLLECTRVGMTDASEWFIFAGA